MQLDRSLHGEHHEELSPALVELKAKPMDEQGAFWRETAAKLAPFAIGKTAGSLLDYDVLGRYFNGTSMGLNFIFDKVNCSDGVEASQFLDQEALAQVFVTHFGFLADCTSYKVVLRKESFIFLCRMLGAHDGAKASQASVRYAVRRLRIGALLHMGLDHQDLYHYDYDDKICEGSFEPPVMGGSGFASRRIDTWDSGKEHADRKAPRVRPQISMMAPEDLESSEDLTKRVHEYLFRSPQDWPGKVHWVHAHKPSKFLVLALGQQHHWRIHAQGVLSRLQAAHPQHNFGSAGTGTDSGSPDWFLMTFPAVVLDDCARRSLQRFQEWERTAMAKARSSSEIDEPPPVHVGVVTYQAALVWSGSSSYNTVVSMTGDAEYIGKWTNQVPITSLAGWWHSISCCQRRKRRHDGYEALSQDEKDLETTDEFVHSGTNCIDSVNLRVKEAEAAREGSFEHVFEDILLLLAESNSLLRMGTHVQLACRILLSWTSAHVEVVQLYVAAISRMQHQLAQKDHPDKEILIGKISMAKLEISTLIRKLDPFMRYVMPDFHTLISKGDFGPRTTSEDPERLAAPHRHKSAEQRMRNLSEVIRMHHLVDIENNLRQVMQDLESQRNLCDSIIGEYDRKSADKVNNILNFLTIITFLVMPAQILTGIYGMNFEVMPELKWKHGYPHYFLCASFIGTLVFATFLCIYRSMI